MPAMPPATPSASAIPGLTAIAARFVAGGNAADAATIDDASPMAFSSHLQRLMGKQLAIELDAGRLQAPEAKVTMEVETAEDLAALLPFIDALGLTQTQASTEFMENAPGELLVSEQTVPLAVPATPSTANPSLPIPAISAVQASPQAQAHGVPFQISTPHSGTTQISLPITQQPSSANDLPAVELLPATPNPVADTDLASSAPELSAGREFSMQLVSAIAASKEHAQAPGNTAAAVHQAMASALPREATDTRADMVISRPVGSTEWGEEFGNRIAWLANRSESRAELVLNPPHMGRVEVNLTVKGDQATASFASNNPVVREALEAALPRLREILAEAGIQLGQSQVSAENPRQWAQQEKHGDNSASDPDRTDGTNPALFPVNSGSLSTNSGIKGGRGLVDVFA